MEQLLNSARKGLAWLEEKIKPDGSIRGFPEDLACYYKAPTLLFISGKLALAQRVLDHIKSRFMTPEGDFLTGSNNKSASPAFQEFWAYTNGWIVTASQRMGRFDISYPGWKYLQHYFDPKLGGFKTFRQPNILTPQDVLTTSHLGFTALYMGHLAEAEKAAAFLHQIIERQSVDKVIYLRMSHDGKIVSTFPDANKFLFEVNLTEPNQAYFMLGYPLAFLCKLFLATKKSQYIDSAKYYFDYLYESSGNLRTFFFSHKVAWGASAYSAITGDPRGNELALEISNYLVSIQEKDGSWLNDADPLTLIDQTVEISTWLTVVGSGNLQPAPATAKL
jgi:hypothetical protein